MTEFARYVNALVIYILSGVLLGAYYIEYLWHEDPCPLCFLQRLGMIGVAVGELLNVRFGIRVRHYALSFFSAILGISVSIRQITLHICPGFPKFGEPVFGLDLYTWAFIVFACVILGNSLLLCFYNPWKTPIVPKEMNWFFRISFILIFLITLGNIFSVLQVCGLGSCSG